MGLSFAVRTTRRGSGEDRRAPSAGLNRSRLADLGGPRRRSSFAAKRLRRDEGGSGSKGLSQSSSDTPGGHRDYTSLSATTPDHLQFTYGYRNAVQLAAGAGHNTSQNRIAAASDSSENSARTPAADDSAKNSARAGTNDHRAPPCIDRGFRNGPHGDGRQGDTVRERGG